MKRIISKIENNSLLRLFAVVILVFGGLITIGTFTESVTDYFYEKFFTANNITNHIKGLSAGQSIDYFKQYLGAQLLQEEISEKFVEYVFKYKSAYIQTLVNKTNDSVVYWAITYCGDSSVIIERPAFLMGGYVKGEKDSAGNEIIEPILISASSTKQVKLHRLF